MKNLFFMWIWRNVEIKNLIYFIEQKMFLFDILEAVWAYDLVKIRFTKEKEVILSGNTNDKSRGI